MEDVIGPLLSRVELTTIDSVDVLLYYSVEKLLAVSNFR